MTEEKNENASKVTEEVAIQDFERFCEEQGIEVDVTTLNEEDLASYNKQKGLVVAAIMAGKIVIDEEGCAVFTYKGGTVTFEEPDGSALLAMDRAKKGEDIKAMNLCMGAITGTDAKTFARMKMRDLKVCMAITALFLAS